MLYSPNIFVARESQQVDGREVGIDCHKVERQQDGQDLHDQPHQRRAGLNSQQLWRKPDMTMTISQFPAVNDRFLQQQINDHKAADFCLFQTGYTLIKHRCIFTCSECRGPVQPPGHMWWSPWQECRDREHSHRSVEPQECPAGSSPPSSTTHIHTSTKLQPN